VASGPPGRLTLSTTDPASFAEAVKDVLVVWEETGVGYTFHPDDGWPRADSTMTDWGLRRRRREGVGRPGWAAIDPAAPDPVVAITTTTRTPSPERPVHLPPMRP
jgi:hypothetical protein